MTNFTTFISVLFSTFSDFCLSEPIIYFLGVFLVLFIIGILKKLIS